jgi:hypothetical protein
MIFVALSGGADLDCLLPLVTFDFMRVAQDIADVAARGGYELSALKQHVDSLHWTPDDDAAARLKTHLKTTTARAFAAPACTDGDATAVACWFTNTELAVRGPDRPRYAVRTSCADDPLWLASWLRLAAGAANRRAPRLVLWDRRSNAAASHIRVLYDDLSNRYAPGMIYGTLSHDLAFDVGTRALPGAQTSSARALTDPETPLQALLAERESWQP